ncbi:hypothetical protein [Mycobacterium sp. C31M]
MTDTDIAPHRQLLLGVVDAGGVRQFNDAGRVRPNSPADPIRVRAADLRSLSSQVAAIRAHSPTAGIVVDIDVMIAHDAAAARAALARRGGHDGRTLLYVGTPIGLAGLIADIHALGLADGAVLQPLDDGVPDLIRDAVLPELRTMTAA